MPVVVMSDASGSEKSLLSWLPSLGLAEGTSTLLLFGAAMPAKYFAGLPMAVSIVGMLHGLLFMVLLFLLAQAIRAKHLSAGTGILGMLSAVLPFGPFLFHHRLPHSRKSLPQALVSILVAVALLLVGLTVFLARQSPPAMDPHFLQSSLCWTTGAVACGFALAFAAMPLRLFVGLSVALLSIPYFGMVWEMISSK